METSDIRPHSAADLRYSLMAGRVSLAPLRVLRCHSIEAHGWHVRFVILGASHAVVLERGDSALTEFLTCIPPIPDSSLGDSFALAIPKTQVIYRLPSGLGIDESRVALSLFRLTEGDAFEGVFEPECRLDLQFPVLDHKDPAAKIPLTRIGWQVTTDGLAVETIHTYPEEGIGVRSGTSFVLVSHEGAGSL